MQETNNNVSTKDKIIMFFLLVSFIAIGIIFWLTKPGADVLYVQSNINTMIPKIVFDGELPNIPIGEYIERYNGKMILTAKSKAVSSNNIVYAVYVSGFDTDLTVAYKLQNEEVLIYSKMYGWLINDTDLLEKLSPYIKQDYDNAVKNVEKQAQAAELEKKKRDEASAKSKAEKSKLILEDLSKKK